MRKQADRDLITTSKGSYQLRGRPAGERALSPSSSSLPFSPAAASTEPFAGATGLIISLPLFAAHDELN